MSADRWWSINIWRSVEPRAARENHNSQSSDGRHHCYRKLVTYRAPPGQRRKDKHGREHREEHAGDAEVPGRSQ